VLVGLALDNLSTAIGVRLASWAWTGSTNDLLVIMIVLGAGSSVLGGYAAGRFAGFRETLHGALVGFGDVVIGVVGMHYFEASLPAWYTVVSFLSVVPAATLGGRGAARSRQKGADR
jgi:hypothetical protein